MSWHFGDAFFQWRNFLTPYNPTYQFFWWLSVLLESISACPSYAYILKCFMCIFLWQFQTLRFLHSSLWCVLNYVGSEHQRAIHCHCTCGNPLIGETVLCLTCVFWHLYEKSHRVPAWVYFWIVHYTDPHACICINANFPVV